LNSLQIRSNKLEFVGLQIDVVLWVVVVFLYVFLSFSLSFSFSFISFFVSRSQKLTIFSIKSFVRNNTEILWNWESCVLWLDLMESNSSIENCCSFSKD
jgi:hypothetical protein